MTDTKLDRLFAGMDLSETARLQFFSEFADTELFVLLDCEPDGEDITPKLFPLEGQNVVLAFDTELRLASFADGVAPYIELPGRVLAQILADLELGLGLNLDVAPSSTLLDVAALNWLSEILDRGDGHDIREADLAEVSRPGPVPEAMLEALGARLTASAGLADFAVLADAEHKNGSKGIVLAIVGAAPRAEAALARAVSEALTFSGIEAGYLDIAFLPEGHPVAAQFAKVGLRFEIPKPSASETRFPKAPGSDPDAPPKLR